MRLVLPLCVALVSLSFNVLASLNLQVEQISGQLKSPWAIAVLPDQNLLITEKAGSLQFFNIDTGLVVVDGAPEVFFAGQGGLLDVKLHPNFQDNKWVYLSYASGTKKSNALAIGRGKLEKDGQSYALTEFSEVFKVTPSKNTPVHYGGRMTFLNDGTLLVTSGDGFDFRESAQDKTTQLGKILRLNDDGSIPKDNPFNADSSADPYLFSLGHRNPQGMLYDAVSHRVWSHEHGPAGGDEINHIVAGKNYGWPVITNGKDYSGASISPFTEYPGMEQPIYDWTPSVAPSDMILYRGFEFPELSGSFLVTTLKTQELLQVKRVEGKVVSHSSLLPDLKERYRAIQTDALGNIYLATDSGKLFQLTRPQ